MSVEHKMIDWNSPTRVVLARSYDLCHVFDSAVPGCLHVRSMPVVIIPERIAHVIEKGADGRVHRLRQRPELILRTLESPEIVEAVPEERPSIGHYKITFVAEDDREPGVYIGVAVSLANFPGQPECDEHFVFTVYCPEYRTFFTPQGEIKARWRRVERSPWPRTW